MTERADNKKRVPELTSRVMDIIRFPLIVGVVFIHAVFPPESLPEGGEDLLPLYHIVVSFFGRMVPSVIVPTFFIVSGYLFYFSMRSFSLAGYLEKLKSRCRTLLIPYLFWSLLLYIFILAFKGIISFSGYSGNVPFPLCLWAASGGSGDINFPLVGQFWYVRDLMVCVLLSPLLYWIIYHTRHFGIILLAIAWIVGYVVPLVGPNGLSLTSLFFFSVGGWCARYRSDIAVLALDLRWLAVLWPVLIALQFAGFGGIIGTVLFNLMTLTGIVGFLCCAVWIVERYNLRPVPLLSASSFFIYAFHAQWGLSPLRRLIFAVYRPESDIAYTLVYFSYGVLTVLACVGIYYLLSRYAPRIAAFISGGRVN